MEQQTKFSSRIQKTQQPQSSPQPYKNYTSQIQQISNLSHTEYYSEQPMIVQLKLDTKKGIVIKILTNQLLQKSQYLYLTISDDTLTQKLRKNFSDIYQLFKTIKKKQNIQIDPKLGKIKIKITKIIGNKQIDQSVVLALSFKEIEVEDVYVRFIEFKGKIYEQDMEVNARGMKLEYMKIKEDLMGRIEEIKSKVDKQNILLRGKIRKLVRLVLVLFVIMLVISGFLYNRTVSKPLKTHQQANMNQILSRIQKLDQKYIQIYKLIQLKQNQSDKFVKDASKKIMEVVDGVKIGVGDIKRKFMQIQKQNQKLKQNKLKDNTNSKINALQEKVDEFLNKYNQFILNHQIDINNIKESIKNNTSTTNTNIQSLGTNTNTATVKDKTTKKLQNIQQKIQHISKLIKRTSIFDLNSAYLQSFQILQGRKLINLATSGRWTQILLRDAIPYDKVSVYQFKIIRSTKNAIIIGVVDAMRISHRNSILHNNTVAYSGKGQLWSNGQLQANKYTGFTQGDRIKMEVQLSKGIVRWFVNQELRIETVSERIKDNILIFRPYVEMAQNGDIIEFVRDI